MKEIKTDYVLDAKGLSCPMPIVKTKRVMDQLQLGHVLEVQATDKGSKADIQAWAENAGHQYVGTIEDGGVLKHYLRKSSGDEKAEKNHPHVMNNEELQKHIQENKNFVLLDVREGAEYAFNHIPQALSIPLGELEARLHELNKDDKILVICRTGSRSDLAAQKLTEKGFEKVFNIVPGMSEWSGETTAFNH